MQNNRYYFRHWYLGEYTYQYSTYSTIYVCVYNVYVCESSMITLITGVGHTVMCFDQNERQNNCFLSRVWAFSDVLDFGC